MLVEVWCAGVACRRYVKEVGGVYFVLFSRFRSWKLHRWLMSSCLPSRLFTLYFIAELSPFKYMYVFFISVLVTWTLSVLNLYRWLLPLSLHLPCLICRAFQWKPAKEVCFILPFRMCQKWVRQVLLYSKDSRPGAAFLEGFLSISCESHMDLTRWTERVSCWVLVRGQRSDAVFCELHRLVVV